MIETMQTTISLSRLANMIQAEKACRQSGNSFADTHEENIDAMLELLPHGSGIDSGVKLLKDECTNDKLVFSFGFHHMNESGYYDGWTEHKLIVTPSLIHGFSLKITGRDRNYTKEYLYDLFSSLFTLDK
jgi:hypothetical protein